MMRENRRAFVVIELSIAVTIVAILIAAVMPAVQRAHAASLESQFTGEATQTNRPQIHSKMIGILPSAFMAADQGSGGMYAITANHPTWTPLMPQLQ